MKGHSDMFRVSGRESDETGSRCDPKNPSIKERRFFRSDIFRQSSPKDSFRISYEGFKARRFCFKQFATTSVMTEHDHRHLSESQKIRSLAIRRNQREDSYGRKRMASMAPFNDASGVNL